MKVFVFVSKKEKRKKKDIEQPKLRHLYGYDFSLFLSDNKYF